MKTGWDAPLTDWIDEVKTSVNNEILQLTKEAFNRIKARTPVDSGKLQAGWVMKQMISEGIVSVEIVNNVEYAVITELGSSTRVGIHMLEQTLNEMIEGTI